MKKFSLLISLLFVSVMGWAADYCNTAMTSVQGHNATVTMRLVGGTTYEFSITTVDNITSFNAAGSNFYANKDGVGGYHVSEYLTQNGNTLSVQFTSTSTPSIYANALYIVLEGIGENQFNIPMDASWAECGGGGGPTYAITVNQPAAGGGTIAAGVAEAAEGATVNLTATPDAGKALDEWIVRDAGDNEVTVTANHFTMPASAVTVTATFKDHDPNEYTAGGHTIHLDASYVGDIYTLVITSADDMEGLSGSYWNVNGVGGNRLSDVQVVSGDKKTITCQVQSTSAPNIYTPLYIFMPGEINFGDVTLNWEDRTPINSEYCKYEDSQTIKGGKNIALTWETDGSGNVIITMQPGTGTTSCSFRNGGFEGGIAAFVVSDDDFVTTTPASDYFTAVQVYSGNTYTLTKTADLPANAKIKHVGSGHALAWVLDGNNEYCFPDFIYTYGGTCNQLDAPTNVSIDANNIITFDAVAGADSYTAYVSLGGVEKYSQVVATGDELTYTPLVDGDYDVTVVASGAGKTDSDPSTAFVWSLTAAPIVLGNSEYCEHLFGSGNQQAALTWETDGSGNIVITISDVIDGTEAAAHFRGNGMALGNFQVGAGKTAASTYFNHSCSGNQVTLSLKDPLAAPTPGEKIYFTSHVVEYTTKQNTKAYGDYTFEYTYGTVCAGKAVSATSNNNTMGTAVVQKAGVDVTSVDDGDEVTFIATVADAEQYRFINWTKGGVEVSTNATYVTTITESTNLVANFDYIRNTYCQYTVTSNASAVQGKKLYMTLGSIGGGQYQIKFEGSAEAPLTALNNANYTVNWVTTTIVDGDKKMSGQDVPFNNARWSFDAAGNGSATMTFGIADGHTWEDIYVWNHSIFFATAAGELGYSGFPDRYHIAWTETCVDAEKPVMTSASLASNTASTAVLNVAATDDHVVDAFHVVDGTNGIDETFPAAAQITLTGLAGGTTYNFEVTAIDATGKESDTPADVQVIMAAAASPVPTEAAPVPTWPADQVMSIYSNAYDFAPASLNSYNEGWYLPPTMAEENIGGDNYLRYHTNMSGMVGWQFGQISVALMEYIHVDIWPSEDGTITMGPTSADDPNRVASVTLNVVAGQWNSFNISIAELQAANASFDVTKVFQNQFTGYSAQTTFSVDNVYFYRTTPPPADLAAPTDVTVNSAVASFTSVTIKAQANDDSGVVHFKVLNGTDVLVADVEVVSGAEATLNVTGLAHSTAYTFSLIAFDAAGHEAAPVAVPVTTLAVPAAAPQPTHDELAVLSVYSNEYTPAVAASFNKSNWGSAPVAYEGDYLLYNMSSNVIVWGNHDGNAGYGNIDGLSGKTHGTTPGLDVSGMKYIHFDVWCDKADQLNTVNINDVAVTIPTTRTVAGDWVSFDVDITGVALADRQNVRWLKFHPFSTTECNAAIDNVYFWQEPKYTRNDAWMAPGELGTVCYPEGLRVAGATMYQMAGTDANGKFVFDEVEVLAPGVPYLFEAQSNELRFYATAATPAAEAGTSNGMVGTFTEITIPQNSPNIYYFTGTKFYAVTARSTDLTVLANRAYVDLTTPHPAMAPKPGMRRIVFDVEGTSTITGCEQIDATDAPAKILIDGQMYILRGEKLYDATGRLVK